MLLNNTKILYQSYYNIIIKRERKSIAVANVVKYQYIDISKLNEILAQAHLLKNNEIIAVKIVQRLPHISNVYCCEGLLCYCTDNETKRKELSWSEMDFRNFEKNVLKYNMQYDEAYISCLKAKGETYFIEHNNKLNEKEISEKGYHT